VKTEIKTKVLSGDLSEPFDYTVNVSKSDLQNENSGSAADLQKQGSFGTLQL